MPKVSVLMPVYKTEESYLRTAIESILNQTFTDFEFLILDDCPEDDRSAVVSSYKDERIIYAKNQKNLGITPSRNKLIEMATGEYLAIFDHDDISLPTRLEKQVAYLDANPDIGVVSSQFEYIEKRNPLKLPINDHDIKLSLMYQCCIWHSASMIRKSVLIENNIHYEEEFSPAEDYALWCRLIPYTKFHNLDEVLFQYRYHENNTSHHQKQKMFDTTLAIRVFVKNKNPELWEEFLLKAEQKKVIRLFNFIPFLTIKTKADKTSIYLFEKLKLLTIKSSIKWQTKKSYINE